MQNNDQKQIAGAILIVGILIAGAILLKDTKSPTANAPIAGIVQPTTLAPIGPTDGNRIMGNPQAKITLVLYEDFQCPFCGKFFKESEQNIRETYVKNGDVQLVYRDFAFLGPESVKASEAARCADDQGKFWDYYDYLFTHQNGENRGGFSDSNLKSFAKALNLETTSFNKCLDDGKYTQAIADSKAEAGTAGVTGTPKGFILKNGKVVDTIDGAIPFDMVKQKLDAVLK